MNPLGAIVDQLAAELTDPARGATVYSHAPLTVTVSRRRYAEAALAVLLGYLTLRFTVGR